MQKNKRRSARFQHWCCPFLRPVKGRMQSSVSRSRSHANPVKIMKRSRPDDAGKVSDELETAWGLASPASEDWIADKVSIASSGSNASQCDGFTLIDCCLINVINSLINQDRLVVSHNRAFVLGENECSPRADANLIKIANRLLSD